jgi:hypothetical protein
VIDNAETGGISSAAAPAAAVTDSTFASRTPAMFCTLP